MECKHEWSYNFMVDNFTKKFVNGELKNHTKEFLFEQQKARFDEAQVIIQRQNRLQDLKEQEQRMREELDEMRVRIYYESRGVWGDVTNSEKSTFTMHCPGNDCRGFLSTAWKCGVCEKRFCAQCFAEKTSNDHECNTDDLETAKLIRKDSKPCPNCGIFIHKLYGCDQMWCTECSTAFSWRTGQVINGQIHNPHFFEARRRLGFVNGRNVQDIPCGGTPRMSEIRDYTGLTNYNEFPFNIVTFVQDMTGIQEDLEHQARPYDMNSYEAAKLRVDFVRGIIDEEEFKGKIFRKDIDAKINEEIVAVINMAHTVMGDSLRQLITGNTNTENLANTMVEIINYTNETLLNISKKYKRVQKFILFKPLRSWGGRGANVWGTRLLSGSECPIPQSQTYTLEHIIDKEVAMRNEWIGTPTYYNY